MKSARWLVLCVLLYTVSFLPACSEAPAAANPPSAPPEVRYIRLSGENIALTRELPGRVSAFTFSEVRPQVGGIIKARLFEEGSDVEAGQVLYEIDPNLYTAAYNSAKANLARVEANEYATRLLAERYGRLVRTHAVSRQEYDDAVAAHRQAKAEIAAYRESLETARINLGYTRVTAPVSGRISRSFVTAGALVTQNQQAPLATVQQISPVYVDMVQSNAQILKLRRELASGRLKGGGPDAATLRLYLEDGSPYTLNRDADGRDEPVWIEGELLFSDVTVEQSTGAVSLRARINNPEGLLMPGMYVRAVLEEGILENALLIPQRSVARDGRNQTLVYVLTPAVRAGKGLSATQSATQTVEHDRELYTVEPRVIVIDRAYKNQWLVSSGLRPGELLLVDGLQRARPGQLVAGTALASPDKNAAVASRDAGGLRRR